MVFEVCDSDFDPHIIKYENPQIILLEVIKNKAGAIDFEFSEKCKPIGTIKIYISMEYV